MAARRHWGIPLPTWTASDSYHTLSTRVKADLRLVASVFDRITDVLIQEQAARVVKKYEMMMKSNQENGANSQPAVENIMEKVAETKRQMTTAYPPLDANAELADLILHISSPGVYRYWEEQCREPNMYAAARAIESLREEALDTYETIHAELEIQNLRPLFELSNTIRLKLRVLESLLDFWVLHYRKLGSRKSVESRSLNVDYAVEQTNVTPAVIAITSRLLSNHGIGPCYLQQWALLALSDPYRCICTCQHFGAASSLSRAVLLKFQYPFSLFSWQFQLLEISSRHEDLLPGQGAGRPG